MRTVRAIVVAIPFVALAALVGVLSSLLGSR